MKMNKLSTHTLLQDVIKLWRCIMKEWIQRKFQQVANDERTLKAKEKLADGGITVPISAAMLMRLFQRQLKKQDQIQNLSIIFQENIIEVKGSVHKYLLKIPFQIKLEPSSANGRVLLFQIHEMKPTNRDFLKKRLFDKPPVTTYKDGQIHIDLNEIDKVKLIPIGTIKQFSIQDNKLRVKIGI